MSLKFLLIAAVAATTGAGFAYTLVSSRELPQAPAAASAPFATPARPAAAPRPLSASEPQSAPVPHRSTAAESRADQRPVAPQSTAAQATTTPDWAAREQAGVALAQRDAQSRPAASIASSALAENESVRLPARRVMTIEPRPPAFVPGRSALPATAPAVPVELELPPGTRSPIAVSESIEGLTPTQADAVTRISNDFADGIEEAVATLPEEEVLAAWDVQQSDADSQFRNIFGEAAYHQRQAASAIEAMGLPLE